MKTSKEVLAAIGGLVAGHMGREPKSPFVSSNGSGDVLEVVVRDQDGESRRFRLTAEEIDPATNAPFQPQASEGDCATECSGEGAKAASDATDDDGCCGKSSCNQEAAAPAAAE